MSSKITDLKEETTTTTTTTKTTTVVWSRRGSSRKEEEEEEEALTALISGSRERGRERGDKGRNDVDSHSLRDGLKKLKRSPAVGKGRALYVVYNEGKLRRFSVNAEY